jgi:hypothetical protein
MANATRRYSEKTIKVLFGSSGNQCAYPGCTNPIVAPETEQSDAAVVAYICHIYAAADNGPRGKPYLTEEERNAPDNLILLCGHQHVDVALIDGARHEIDMAHRQRRCRPRRSTGIVKV